MSTGSTVRAGSMDFLKGGGTTGALIRDHDWRSSPLGEPAAWPQPLRTLVGVMLGSRQPMFVAWGPERIMLYNDGYGMLCGGRHPWALGRPFAEVWFDILDEVGPIMDRAYAGQSTHMDDITLLMHRHGYAEEAHFAFSYTPVRDEMGKVAGMFCVCEETTDKVFAERRLAAEQERQRRMFEQAPGFMAILGGPDHVFEFINASYARLFSEARDFIGRPAREVFPDIEGQGFHELLDKVYATGERFVGEQMPIRLLASPDAARQELLLDFIYEPIVDAATGRVTGIFVEGYDVTERARAEQALRRLNETLEVQIAERTRERDRIWQLSHDLLGVAGFDGYLKAVNPAWTRLLGHTDAAMLEQPFAELIHPNDRTAVETALTRMRRGETVRGFEDRLRAADGSYRWIAWTAVPEGEVFYAIGRDVTAEKQAAADLGQAQEQLRQAQKMEAVGQLTGGVAHDFNNLLQAISSCLHLVERRAGPAAGDLVPLIEAGRQAVERGARLVQQLMAFARREALRPEPVDVRERVLGMSELLTRALRSNITVASDFAPGLWPVLVDPTQLELALINLAVNARDAMPHGGRLRIEATNLPGGGPGCCDAVRVSVSDTGAGMPPEVVARAFEPFFTTKATGQGSGLGLPQVYGFARQSGGTVAIDSAPGRGTTVTLVLPRTPHAPIRRDAEQPVRAQRPTDGARVLLVEDDPEVADMIAAALREAGYDVTRAANADEALAMLQAAAPIDLLLSDVVMPGRLSGVDLVREARRLRPHLPIVLATGYSEEVSRTAGVRVLLKPFPLDTLVEAAEAALGEAVEVTT